MSDKPIIRHCRNCKYAELYKISGAIVCDVKYKYYSKNSQRMRAIFCRHYKQKEAEPEAKQKSAIENLAKACEEFVKNIGG